jgi:hypothetical protein
MFVITTSRVPRLVIMTAARSGTPGTPAPELSHKRMKVFCKSKPENWISVLLFAHETAVYRNPRNSSN